MNIPRKSRILEGVYNDREPARMPARLLVYPHQGINPNRTVNAVRIWNVDPRL